MDGKGCERNVHELPLDHLMRDLARDGYFLCRYGLMIMAMDSILANLIRSRREGNIFSAIFQMRSYFLRAISKKFCSTDGAIICNETKIK